MKKKDAKLISRGLDRELEREEREQLDRLIAENQDAEKRSQAWDQIGDHIRAESAHIKTPDEYLAWQDIRREIRQSERVKESRVTNDPRFRWAGAIAAVLVVGVLAVSSLLLLSGSAPEWVMLDEMAPESRVEWVETEIPGATTVIYTDVETDMTIIWMDIAQNGESRDT